MKTLVIAVATCLCLFSAFAQDKPASQPATQPSAGTFEASDFDGLKAAVNKTATVHGTISRAGWYQDRILFGSDIVFSADNMDLGVPMPGKRTDADAKTFYDTHWKFFETTTRNMDHPSPIQGNWRVNAIDLPPQVLHKLYIGNAKRLIPGLSGTQNRISGTNKMN